MRARGSRLGLFAMVAPVAFWALGCAGEDKVVRVIDGRPVAGEFVPAEAYAAYLRGSIADSAGDLAGAIEGYAIAVTLGPRDPEPLVRLGDARCRKDPHDPRAEDALAKALAIDGSYEPALEAMARCAEKRGDARVAVESARRAMAADPAAVEPLATLARLEPADRGPASEELRRRLVAMTLAEGTNAAAWDALATWARAHGDGLLEARALSQIEPSTEARRREVDAAIARLLGGGETGAARVLARARVEASGVNAGEIDPRIARLALDAALVAGDSRAAHRIATRSHLPDVVVAARALAYGDFAGAHAMASMLVAAEPRAIAPRLVLAVAAGDVREAVLPARRPGPSDAPVPPEVWLLHARAVARVGSTDAVRALLQGIAREPMVPGDPVATPIAVELAAVGALDASELDADGRVELAERRAEPVTDDVIAAADARHRLLALARRAPQDPRTIALVRSLAATRGRDPIVSVAFARLALAGAIDTSPATVAGMLARLDPSDPLVAAAVLDCAVRAGDTRAIPLARARLAAVAHTAAERARAVE